MKAFLLEQALLKGIDKGDIVSSGAPQVSKDGRNSVDFTQPRRTKLGNLPVQPILKSCIYIYVLYIFQLGTDLCWNWIV